LADAAEAVTSTRMVSHHRARLARPVLAAGTAGRVRSWTASRDGREFLRMCPRISARSRSGSRWIFRACRPDSASPASSRPSTDDQP